MVYYIGICYFNLEEEEVLKLASLGDDANSKETLDILKNHWSPETIKLLLLESLLFRKFEFIALLDETPYLLMLFFCFRHFLLFIHVVDMFLGSSLPWEI